MRTLILALAVLLFAAPVWATVTITAEKDVTNDRKVWIGYTSDEGELVRAFALDITVTDGNIIAVEDYAVGDDNGGYGIFPGTFAASITVNPTTGMVDNWAVAGYSPVAPADDPDALPGIGTGGVTIEMGSLYDTQAPGLTEGVLCSVTVDENVTELCVAANAIRGNVVLESAAEVQDLVMPECPTWGECFPSSDPHYNDWVAFNKPTCWCYARQCHGDADGQRQGSIITGYMYVSTNDLVVLADAWQVKEPTKGPGILSVPNGICADFNHDKQGSIITGYMRVSTDDLVILANNWQVKEPTKGPGIPGDCVPVPVEP